MKIEYKQYEEWYYEELSHSEKLSNKISGHLTLITVLGAIIVFIWATLQPGFDDLFLLITSIISSVGFVLCCIFFAITYVGKKYAYVDIKNLIEDVEKIDEIESQYPEYKEMCDAKRDSHLKEYYKQALLENRVYNGKKSSIQHKTIVAILITYCSTVIPIVYWLLAPHIK